VQAYARSLTGLLETKATDAGTWEYGYDLTDQVTNAVLSASGSDGAWGYSYDAMGNRKTFSELSASSGTSALSVYSANRLNQYTVITNFAGFAPWRETSLAYDLNGNMTWDGTNAYFWDLQNQLVLVSNAEVQVSNAYDAMGRRVRKEIKRRDAETQSWEVESTRHFYYDGWNLVRETIHSTLPSFQSSTNLYTWGNDLSGTLQGAGGVGGLLAVLSSGSQPYSLTAYYPLFDHNGNVERYVTRNGVVVATFQYDAFGNTVAQSGTMSGAFAYRFSTKYFDVETGLYYYGYRYYCQWTGRWMSVDPTGESGGLNVNSFVRNDGVNGYDFLGLQVYPSSGQTFNSPDQAAKATGEFWLPDTKMNTWEHCGSVCEHCVLGKMEFYTTHVKGNTEQCSPHAAPCNANDKTVGYWHTHSYAKPGLRWQEDETGRRWIDDAYSDDLSLEDRIYAYYWPNPGRGNTVPLYLTTPRLTGRFTSDNNPSDFAAGVWVRLP